MSEDEEMTVEIAAHAGFCMGVRRAVEAAEKAAGDGIPSCTLGELIHNPAVVKDLAEKGIAPVQTPEEAGGKRVLIRSHGVSPDVLEKLKEQGCEILDLTCPFVDRMHKIVAEGSRDGTPVLLVGEKEHPEVRGTAGWSRGEVYVIATPEEAAELPDFPKALAVAQTTFPPERWEAVLAVLKDKVQDLKSHCTICNATEIRQREAAELAERADRMIVMQKGKLLADGSPSDIFSDLEMIKRAGLELPPVIELREKAGLSRDIMTAEEMAAALKGMQDR